MVFGSIVHEGIEKYETEPKWDYSKLVKWSLARWEEEMGTPSVFLDDSSDTPKPPKSFRTMFKNYIEEISPWLSKDDVEIESFFSIDIENELGIPIKFVGKLDRVEEGKKIIDWKTSGKPPDKYDLVDTQFIAYAWAYEHMFDTRPEVYYGHLGTGKLYNIEYDNVHLDEFEKLLDRSIETVYNMVKVEQRQEGAGFPRSMGYDCRNCPFNATCFAELENKKEDVFVDRGIY